MDVLFVQLPSVYGLQCRVSDPQFTSNSFTLLVNSRLRGRDRFHHPRRVQCRSDLPRGTAGTAGDPHGNVPEVPSDIPSCCVYSWRAACFCRYGHAQGAGERNFQSNRIAECQAPCEEYYVAVCALSKFQPFGPPIRSGMFSLSNSSSSADRAWGLYDPSAMSPKQCCCMSHRNGSAARRTLIISSLGSTISSIGVHPMKFGTVLGSTDGVIDKIELQFCATTQAITISYLMSCYISYFKLKYDIRYDMIYAI